jgi:hypothetical protein
MSTAIVIHWIERGTDLLEARAVLPDGRDVYAGYVAASPGQSAWRGYVGSNFAPLGMGPRSVMQRAVAQMVVDIMRNGGSAQQRATLEWDGGGEDGGADTKTWFKRT